MQPENDAGAPKKPSMLRKIKKASSKLWKSATGQTDDRGRFVAPPPPSPIAVARAPPPRAPPPPPAVAAAAAPADAKQREQQRLEKKRRRAAAKKTAAAATEAGAPPAPTRPAPRPPPPRAVPPRSPVEKVPTPRDLGIPGAAARVKADGDGQFRANNVVAARESYTRALDRLGAIDDAADAVRRSFRAALLSNRAACDMALARQHGAAKARVCYSRAQRDCTAAVEAAPTPYARAVLRRGQAKLAVGNTAGAIEDAFGVEQAVAEVAATDGQVSERGQAEIKEARELVERARLFEVRRRALAAAARPKGGAGRSIIDVAAVSSARKALVDAVPSAAAGPLADACAALAAGDGLAATPKLDECFGMNARGAPPGGGAPPRAALLVLKARASLIQAADAKQPRRVRNRALMAAATHLGLARTAAPGQADAAAFIRLTRRHALLEVILTDGVSPARLAALGDALAGLRCAPKPCTLDEDLRHCAEEATDRAAGAAARDDVAKRLARGESETPPPPPPRRYSQPQRPRPAAEHRPPPPPAAGRPPPPPRAAPSRRPAQSAAAHERAFAAFERRLAAAAEGSLHMADVPLPPPGAVCAARTASARKKAVRAALLRWHPDKFNLSKFSSEDRGAVAEAVADVCQLVYKEKKKLAR